MNQRIKKYLDDIFEKVPNNRNAMELKEELTYNMNEKYNDLIGEGYSEKDAYDEVVKGVGNVDELLANTDSSYAKKIFLVSCSTMTAVYFIVSFLTQAWYITWVIFLTPPVLNGIIAIMNELKVAKIRQFYHQEKDYIDIRSNDGEPVHTTEEKADTINYKKIGASINAALGSAVLIVYFLLSFATQAWHITWVLFLLTPLFRTMLNNWLEQQR